MIDRPDLDRFLRAQAPVYRQALNELRVGRKRSHWMWFIFPQLRQLGRSETAQFYGIESADEAHAYLAHPILGARLYECCAAVLPHAGTAPEVILGSIDSLKLRSSMTLFEAVAGPGQVFGEVLAAFYAGERDRRTLDLLKAAPTPLRQP